MSWQSQAYPFAKFKLKKQSRINIPQNTHLIRQSNPCIKISTKTVEFRLGYINTLYQSSCLVVVYATDFRYPFVILLRKFVLHSGARVYVKPRSHCADLEVPISTTWKIVENGMVGSWSRGKIVLTSWKSARSGNDRQWSGSQYDKVLL